VKEHDPAVVNALHRELNELFGWEQESLLHALSHIRNSVLNLRADVRTEKFLREAAEKEIESLKKMKLQDQQ
jgi:hypothetical protein